VTPQVPFVEPVGTMHEVPRQQSAAMVQPPPSGTQVVLPQRRTPLASGTQAVLLQQSPE
jgi:hypothetical protein